MISDALKTKVNELIKDALEYSSNLRFREIVSYKLAADFISSYSDGITYVADNEKDGLAIFKQIANAFCKANNLSMITIGEQNLVHDDNNFHGAFSYRQYTDKTFIFNFVINEVYLDSLLYNINHRENKIDIPILTRLSLDNMGGLDSNNILFNAPKIEMPSSIMYPWFTDSPETIAHSFMKSSANVLVLYGDPGTGKTTFIKKILQNVGFEENRSVNVVDTPDVMNSPELVSSIYASKNKDIYIFEDVDRHLYSRKEGNDVMAGLLNAAEGLASPDVKIIISTNIKNLSDIDSALIRPGRCFKTLEFVKLEQHEQIAVREFLGLDVSVCTANRKSLAEVMNEKATEKPVTFGFNMG